MSTHSSTATRRKPRFRRGMWFLVLIGLLLTLLNGHKGASAPTQPIATSAPQPTVTAATQPAAAPTVPSALPVGPADFVLHAVVPQGGAVSIEGRFGPIGVADRSGASPSVVAECSGGNGRELVAQLKLTTTVESSQPTTVELGNFRSSSAADNPTRFIMDYNEGESCLSEVGSESQLDLGVLAPHQPHNFTAWVVLNNAITADHPVPTLKALGEGWSMAIPHVYFDGRLISSTTVQGSRVISCEEEPFITAAGTPPVSAATGTEGQRASCQVQRRPILAF